MAREMAKKPSFLLLQKKLEEYINFHKLEPKQNEQQQLFWPSDLIIRS